MPFTGQAEAVIDAKQRLALPAKFRARWDPSRDGPTWLAVPWIPDRAIRLYTEKTFDELFRGGRPAPSLFPSPEQAELERAVFSITEQLEPDPNHRVRLPAWQIERLGLERDVMVIGAGDRLEIHARGAWNENFDAMLGRIAELAMTQRPRPSPPGTDGRGSRGD